MSSDILIHAWPDAESHTLGCVGLVDAQIDVLFDAVDEGTPVLILPWTRILYDDGDYGVAVVPHEVSRRR